MRPLLLAHQRAGRVLEVGDEVRRAGGGLPHRRDQALGVRAAPAVVDRHRAPPGRRGRRRCPCRRDTPAARPGPGRPAPTYSDSARRTACSAPLVTRICSGVVGQPALGEPRRPAAPAAPAPRGSRSRSRAGNRGSSSRAAAYAACSCGGALGAAWPRSTTPSGAGSGAQAGTSPASPGSVVQVPDPCRLAAYPDSRSRSYAAAAVVRLRPEGARPARAPAAAGPRPAAARPGPAAGPGRPARRTRAAGGLPGAEQPGQLARADPCRRRASRCAREPLCADWLWMTRPIGPEDRPMRQLPRRIAQLYVGLGLYAVSMALVIQSGLGEHAVGRLPPGAGPPGRADASASG